MEGLKATDIIDCRFGIRRAEGIRNSTLVICPKCGERVAISDFIDIELPCELCGEHYSIQCPKCDAEFDGVHSNELFLLTYPSE